MLGCQKQRLAATEFRLERTPVLGAGWTARTVSGEHVSSLETRALETGVVAPRVPGEHITAAMGRIGRFGRGMRGDCACLTGEVPGVLEALLAGVHGADAAMHVVDVGHMRGSCRLLLQHASAPVCADLGGCGHICAPVLPPCPCCVQAADAAPPSSFRLHQ